MYLKTDPFQHQLEILEDTWDRPYWAYFMQMGTGKSKIVIDGFVNLYRKDMIDAVLIWSINGVHTNWAVKEIPKHSDDVNIFEWSSYRTGKFYRLFQRFLEDKTRLRCLCMNVEGLSRAGAYEAALEFLKVCRKPYIAVDESTCIKNPKVAKTKRVLQLGLAGKYKRILSGAPITENPFDLWAQARFLNHGLLDRSMSAFKSRYAIFRQRKFGHRSFMEVESYTNLEELRARVKPWSTEKTKDECLDLPPKLYEQRYIDLTTKQREVYERMKKDSFLEIEGKFITAENALHKLYQLHAITCGYVSEEEGKQPVWLPSNRIDALKNLIDEAGGESIVIWCWARPALENIRQFVDQEYPGQGVYYFGGIERDERVCAVERFESRDARIFVGNQQTAGHGLTLNAASYVIYYLNHYRLELRLQSEDRSHRIGQDKRVTYIDLVARDTVDEKVREALMSKQDVSGKILHLIHDYLQ